MASVVGAVTGGVAGVAVGQAGSVALDPVFEPIKQDAWKNKATRILDADQLATLVAQALNTVEEVLDDVRRNGFDSDELTTLVQLALRAPGVPEAEKLYLRRKADPKGSITLKQLQHAYGKAAIEGQYWDALTAAAETTLLTPAQLALGIVRGTIKNPGLMVKELDTSDSNVLKYTPAALNTLDEAAASGFNAERLRALVGSIGLPMSTHEAASAYFRSLLTLGGYRQSILEGDVRPEWADVILEQARAILSPHDYMENYLRGWTKDFSTALANTAKHGMSVEDATKIYQNLGRPLAIHQITTGLARGGTFGGYYEGVPDPYLSAVKESNIRPEYGNLDYANRYSYPSGFQIKSLATGGDITEAETEQLLLEVGWPPKWAALFAAKWTGGKTGSAPEVKSAKTKLLTAIHKAYVAGSANDIQATAALQGAAYDTTTIDGLLTIWGVEKAFLQAIAPPPPGPTT